MPTHPDTSLTRLPKCYRCGAQPCRCEDGITLYHADCRDVLPLLEAGSVDLVLTDPPYPTAHTEAFRYSDELLLVLERFDCRQFVFWTPAVPFPLTYSGKRIWDKAVGTNTQFEEIYERNNGSGYKIHRHYRHNNALNAAWVGDISTGHPSQKPIRLIRQFAEYGQTILDPFAGSGTTGVAAKLLGRRCIMVEIEEKYCEIAAERLRQNVLDFG